MPEDHPDDEQLDDSYAALTASTRQRQRSGVIEMSLVAGAAVLIAVSTLFSAWNTFELRKVTQAAAEVRRLGLLGTTCLIEQLAEQRRQSALAHQADAVYHHYPYPIPDSQPPVVPERLEQACASFITSTTTTR